MLQCCGGTTQEIESTGLDFYKHNSIGLDFHKWNSSPVDSISIPVHVDSPRQLLAQHEKQLLDSKIDPNVLELLDSKIVLKVC